jgi:hypothetical protein
MKRVYIKSGKPRKKREGKPQNLDAKRSTECSKDSRYCTRFWNSDNLQDWMSGKSRVTAKAPCLF